MSPHFLKQFWALIEQTQSAVLLGMDDSSLVDWLAQQLKTQPPSSQEEQSQLKDYIWQHLPLIRDLAQSRQAVCVLTPIVEG